MSRANYPKPFILSPHLLVGLPEFLDLAADGVHHRVDDLPVDDGQRRHHQLLDRQAVAGRHQERQRSVESLFSVKK